MQVTAKTVKYGNNVDTDVIIPARYLNTTNRAELAAHCMEDIDGDFHSKISKGDIITAGKNFGCGSSREHAPIAIKESGISIVLAESFARIFYRNAINIGLTLVEHPEAARDAKEGDTLSFDFDKGRLANLTQNKCYDLPQMEEFVRAIIDAGGLLKYAARLATED